MRGSPHELLSKDHCNDATTINLFREISKLRRRQVRHARRQMARHVVGVSNRILVPSSGPDSWSAFLAEPDKQWKKGFSARTLAYSWESASGFPIEIEEVLKSSFEGPEILLAIPEHQVPLPGGARPSQNDLWVLARSRGQLVSIAVEGKVAEPFGPTIDEWRASPSTGKTTRLKYLLELLDIPEAPGNLRYQLLHRTASALIEARRFNSKHAVMLVHSFSQSHQWFEDYSAFVELIGGNPTINGMTSVGPRSDIELHLGWVCGEAGFLER